MIKRLMDVFVSSLGLLITSPLLIPVLFLVWFQDFHSPFYVAPRVGKNGKIFKMVKIRSMRVNADRAGIDSTSADDSRITSVGRFVRRYKLDEIGQLWNVLTGDMSLVGPRPNVPREVALYTEEEKKLLSTKPGITDFASIVFADEGEVLKGSVDPDLSYHQLIRPWKNRLGLLYIQKQSTFLDLQLVYLTGVSTVSRENALNGISHILNCFGADSQLVKIARRQNDLTPFPPPGAKDIVKARLL